MTLNFSPTSHPFREIQNSPNKRPSTGKENPVTQKSIKSNLENISPIPFPSFNKPTPKKIEHIGKHPQYLDLENPKSSLGSGSAKSVVVMTVLKKSLAGKNQKVGWKDVAHSKQAGNKIGQDVELRVLKALSKDEDAKNVTPKVYYAGIHDGQLVTSTKLISGGEARHCFPYMPISDRLRALIGYGQGLKFLHSKGIIHNDTAYRNMLVELPAEKMIIEDALNYRLARPIFDLSGKTLFEKNEKITLEIQAKIKSLNFSHVKVYVNQPPRGFLTDFDRCHFKGDLTSKVLLGCPIDASAPERNLASDQYQKLKDSNAPLVVLSGARTNIILSSTVESDAFSLGQLICDAILRPDLSTNVAEKGEYNIYCQARKEKRMREYLENPNSSAIEESDYLELNKIDPDLAMVAFDLMNYQPGKRLRIEDALAALENIVLRLPKRDVSYQIYDDIFETFDDAKKPKISMTAFNMFSNFPSTPVTKQSSSGYGYGDDS